MQYQLKESRLARERLINNSAEVDIPEYVAKSFLTDPKHKALVAHIQLISRRMGLELDKQKSIVLGYAVLEVMKSRGV